MNELLRHLLTSFAVMMVGLLGFYRQPSKLVKFAAGFAIGVILATAVANAHEPHRDPNAGSIPVYGRGPVVGYWRPTLQPVPTLFPHIFARYRRGYVYQPVDHHARHPQAMPSRNPQPQAMPPQYTPNDVSYTFDYQRDM